MSDERLKMFEGYIKQGSYGILLEDITDKSFPSAVILDVNCDLSLLNGHYEGVNFVPPTWYLELKELEKTQIPVLVINNINGVSKQEQNKFIEILKYRKISTFELPKNCVIILTCSNLKEKPVSEEIYSLVAHI